MVFMDFRSVGSSERFRFVGSSKEAILADTHGGKEFGGQKFSGSTVISEAEARAQPMDYLEDGITSVRSGLTNSYLVGIFYPA